MCLIFFFLYFPFIVFHSVIAESLKPLDAHANLKIDRMQANIPCVVKDWEEYIDSMSESGSDEVSSSSTSDSEEDLTVQTVRTGIQKILVPAEM